MANLNKVLLMGNLTRDPELRYISSGTAVTSFRMAINRKYKQGDEFKDEVCYVDVTVWAKQAENCAEYLSKGSAVFVEGHLRFNTWETDTGEKRNKLEVVANNVQFLSRAMSAGGKPSNVETPGPGSSGKDDVPF
ncbi:MAG: single-stranded DNA-binding protein [Nitrospinales bacterium]